MSGTTFRRQVDVFISRNLSPQQQSVELARVAKAGVAELIRTGQAPPTFTRYVDGVEGAAEERVRHDGVIVYRFEFLADALAYALAFLRQRSPPPEPSNAEGDRRPYADSFFVGLDGNFVPASRIDPAKIGQPREVIIGNTKPYNRLVDVQLAGGKRVKFSTPAQIFSDAARAVRRQFGTTVTARTLRTVVFPGQWVLRDGLAKGSRVQSPALVITPRE